MNHTVNLAEEFGSRLSNGEDAYVFRLANIDKYLSLFENLTLDFSGVRLANSSFVNALISGLLEEHGEDVLKKLTFRGCGPTIRVLVEAAIDLGLVKHGERVK